MWGHFFFDPAAVVPEMTKQANRFHVGYPAFIKRFGVEDAMNAADSLVVGFISPLHAAAGYLELNLKVSTDALQFLIQPHGVGGTYLLPIKVTVDLPFLREEQIRHCLHFLRRLGLRKPG